MTNKGGRRVHFLSETLEWAEYDGDLKVLKLKFKKGGVYRYEAVPPRVFRGLLEAPSKGRYFHDSIDQKYEFEKLKP